MHRRPQQEAGEIFGLCLSWLLAAACTAPGYGSAASPATAAGPPSASSRGYRAPVCGYQVVASHPHDAQAYTQGLAFDDGELFEGTGRHGESSLRRVELATGQVLQAHQLPDDYFGEGITLLGDRIFQLTWLSQVGFVYDRASFTELGSFSYASAGWGLTNDGSRLIMSDGTTYLSLRDPVSFDEIQRVQVRDGETPISYLNELEWVRGELWANVYPGDLIARIDPDSGRVIAWLDLAGILDPRPATADVLNGIAFDAVGGRVLVTGKLWPTLFEIEVVGEPPLPLFSDGFAAGATTGWSRAVGER